MVTPDEHSTSWRLFGSAMVVGPALLVASFVVFATSDGGLNADELGGVLLVYAFVGLLLAAVGIVRALEGSFPRAAALLVVLAAVGCAGGVGFGIDSIHAGVPGGLGLEDTDSAAGNLGLFLPGLVFPLSFVGLGVALWKARIPPVGSGPLLAVAAALFPLGNIADIEAVAVVSAVTFALALVPLGSAWVREGTPGPRPADAAPGAVERVAAAPSAG